MTCCRPTRPTWPGGPAGVIEREKRSVMVAMTSLLDAVMEDSASGRADFPVEERARLAAVLVAACLDERAHLEELDTYGPTGRSRRFLAPATGPLFRGVFDQWLSQ